MREKTERKRPWWIDKRSWILYLDKLKEFDTIVSDSVEGNIYIFDCETARLSIWSEKWQAFADVGVSRFLKQERDSKSGYEVENLRTTKIFYKGIELQKRYKEIDAELIEFIDIKGKLDSNLLNLSRGSLTPEGERYLEEKVYPGLLEGVHKALIHLEKKSQGEVDFVERVKKIFDERCVELIRNIQVKKAPEECYTEKREFIAFVVSLSVLSYYACRDEWKLSELLENNFQETGRKWLELIDYINEQLNRKEMENVRIELAKMTNFFNLTVYSESYKELQERNIRIDGRNNGCFSEIFASDKHWAIRQVRRDRYSGWKMQLIQLNEESNRFYNKLIAVPKNGTQDDELEQWADKLCHPGNVKDIQIDSSQQFIMIWLLKNIPTVGMFCSNHGNIRVSVFAPRIYPSIYMNRAFKYLIVERMFKYAEEGIERFSTIVWQGRESLSFRELPFSLFFVKRGYLSKHSYRKCIVPIHGERLIQWSKLIKKDLAELGFRLQNLLNAIDIERYLYRVKSGNVESGNNADILMYLNVEDTDVIIEIVNEFHEIILENLKTKDFVCNVSLNELLESSDKLYKEWESIYETMVRLYRTEKESNDDNELFGEITTNPGFDLLCSAWFYIFIGGLSQVEKEFEIYKENNFYQYENNNVNKAEIIKEQRMISYIRDKGLYPGEEVSLRNNLRDYKKELVDLMFEVGMYPIRSRFKEFTRKASAYYTIFIKEYDEHRRKVIDEPDRANRG